MSKLIYTACLFALVSVCQCGKFVSADDALVELLESVKPSVVTIETDSGTGSGFFVASDKVMTNHHVIKGETKVTVKFGDERRVSARGTLFLDEARDIAVLSIKDDDNSPEPFQLLDGLPKQGQDVIALGNPRGFEFTVTRGIVSGVRSANEINDVFGGGTGLSGTWVQTDTAISPGNSGGPLINHEGKVIGMNTFFRVDSQNLNFAISSVDMKSAFATAGLGKLTPFPETSDENPKTQQGDYSFFVKALVDHAEKTIPDLSDMKFRKLKNGYFLELFEPVEVTAIKAGQVARIKADATVIQVLDDGVLMMIGTAICKIEFSPEKSAELKAKFGELILKENVPIDGVYYIGKAEPYETARGSINYRIPLLPADAMPKEKWEEPIAALIVKESEKREEKNGAAREEFYNRVKGKLRRTVKDSTGKFKVDAVVVEVQDGSVTMFRLNDSTKLVVPLSKLSKEDISWIGENEFQIKRHGDGVMDLLEKKE